MKKALDGNFHHKENSCFSGQSKDQEKMGSTDSIYNERLPSAAEGMNQSHMGHSIHPLNDSDKKNGSIPTKVRHSEEEQKDSTTSLQKKAVNYSIKSTASCPVYSNGNLYKVAETNLLAWAMNSSPIIRWFTYPFSTSLGPDERNWFDLMLVSRDHLVRRWGYPKYYILGWDLWQAADLIRRYVTASLSQLINVTVRLDK